MSAGLSADDEDVEFSLFDDEPSPLPSSPAASASLLLTAPVPCTCSLSPPRALVDQRLSEFAFEPAGAMMLGAISR